MKLMLDTNIFNAIADDEVDPSKFQKFRLVSTHVQVDELNRTQSNERKKLLENTISELAPEGETCSIGVWGDSPWGGFKWGENSKYNQLMTELRDLEKANGKKSKKLNRSRHIRIVLTALENNCALVTSDRELAELHSIHGGKTFTLQDVVAGLLA